MLDFSLSNAFLSLLDTEHFHDSTPETSKDKLPLGSSLISPEPIHLGLFSLLIHLPQSRQARGKECLKSSLHSACQVACLDKSFIHKLTFHHSSFLLQAFIILLPQHLTWRRESSFNLLSLLNTVLPTTSQSSCLSEIYLSNLPFPFRSFVQLLIASCLSYLLDNYLSAFCITPTLI